MPSSGYTAWSVVADEQPTAAKWNLLGSNDASFNNGNGFEDNIIIHRHIGGAGMPVQIKGVNYGGHQNGTNIIPFDDTIPQITEGDEYMSISFTPKSATNMLLIMVDAWFSHSGTNAQATVALFQDAISNALSAGEHYENTGTAVIRAGLRHIMIAGTTSPITFRVRIGSQNAGTLTFNGQSGSRRYGGVANSNITVIEYKPN